jgi:hypothetical protein
MISGGCRGRRVDTTRARAVGGLGGNQPDAHALLCARDRGYPLITADAARYTGIRPAGWRSTSSPDQIGLSVVTVGGCDLRTRPSAPRRPSSW